MLDADEGILEGESLPSPVSMQECIIAPNVLTPLHIARTKKLWRLHDQVVQDTKTDKTLSPSTKSQILARCAKALCDLVALDRRLAGLDGGDGLQRGGVLLIPVKASPAEWAEVVEGEIVSEGQEGGEA